MTDPHSGDAAYHHAANVAAVAIPASAALFTYQNFSILALGIAIITGLLGIAWYAILFHDRLKYGRHTPTREG